MYAASAIAANTVCRSALGAVAPLFTEQMFTALGVGGAGSLIGGVAVLLAPIPFMFWKYGARIRARSKFAPTTEAENATSTAEKEDERQTASSRDGQSSSDEEQGIADLEKQQSNTDLEKQESRTTTAPPAAQRRDPYLDATGLEEAE